MTEDDKQLVRDSWAMSSSSSSSKVLALLGVPVSAKVALRHFKPLGLTNFSRTTTRTSTINGLQSSASRDNSGRTRK